MQPDLVIERFAYSILGTFGQMTIGGQTLYTVERPWVLNRPTISCIPEGQYLCRPRRYNRGGYDAVEVMDVPGRSHILFHRGNTKADLAGCIAVTSRLGCLDNTWAGLNSKAAFSTFMDRYGSGDFLLEIVQQRPEDMAIWRPIIDSIDYGEAALPSDG